MSTANARQISKRSEEAAGASEGHVAQVRQRGREAHIIGACDCVIDLAAAFYNLPSRELRRTGRGTDEIARVRQIAMYVAHVVLGLTMTDIGRGFGRDRTTVMHACHLVEDLRDDRDFDQIIARTENIVAAAFRDRLPL
ncbi:MAG: helix-turn-helix domain-containing protein [Rhizobiaceae bacterium]